MAQPTAFSLLQRPPDLGGRRQTPGLRIPLTLRQEPPCLLPTATVSRFRPFFRRRDSTARPQRVAIRARNP
jgi:hypothetical protein